MRQRALLAEALGTLILVATVVGSGIMAETLTQDVALALLCNTIATGAILVVLIEVFGPLSGAHFNPAVTLAFALEGSHPWRRVAPYVAAQCVGAVLGALLAHGMFDLPILQISARIRTGGPQWLSEAVATFGLVLVILCLVRLRSAAVPMAVGLYITAAYWFTASTSFANPAVALGRTFTNTFSGIRALDLPGFVLAQCLGAVIATYLAKALLKGR